MQTLNQHISLFQTFANGHKQIHDFGVGDLWELTEKDGERTYPLMWVQIGDSSVSGNEMVDNYQVVFCDLVHPDESDENEVLSDQKSIALDFLSYLQQSEDISRVMNIVKSSGVQFFTERWEDVLSGVIINVQIKQPFVYDLCSVPFTGLPADYIGCEGVDIYVNGVYTETVESGGRYSYDTGGSFTYDLYFDGVDTGQNITVDGTDITINLN